MMDSKKIILVTGGAGKIGAHFVRKHASDYDITVVDLKTSHVGFPDNVRVVKADLSSYKACRDLTAYE